MEFKWADISDITVQKCKPWHKMYQKKKKNLTFMFNKNDI